MQTMTAPVRPEIDLGHLPLVEKLRDNHPGATMAILDLLRYRRRICDPLDVDALWCLGALDTLNICGSDLCGLWCSCGQSAEQMIQFLKACCDGRCGSGDAGRLTKATADLGSTWSLRYRLTALGS